MPQKPHHIVINKSITLTSWFSFSSEIESCDYGVLRLCSYCTAVSLFGDNEASTPIDAGMKSKRFVPAFLLTLKPSVIAFIVKYFVKTLNKINKTLIFAPQRIHNYTVSSIDFTASKHHKGVVSLDSDYSVISVCCNIEGTTPYFFNSINIFSNATHGKKFTKYTRKWCISNGVFTKRSCKEFIFTSRFTHPIAYSLAQYSNDVQRRFYQTYFKHKSFFSFRFWRYILISLFRFKKSFVKPRCNGLIPFLFEFITTPCFYKYGVKFTRFY